jgi:quinol monooxygenase YgiN
MILPTSHDNIHAIARLEARPDTKEELLSLLKSLLEPTRREPGCIRFELWQSRVTPTDFVVVSLWENAEAVSQHVGTSHATRAMSRLRELLAAPLDLRFYDLLG